MPADLLHELRVASVSVPLKDIGGSLSGLVEMATRKELEELRAKYNDGEPFEADGPVNARRGRPPKI